MAQRHNHYDAAFETYLRERRTPHIVVDEQRRSLMANSSLKSMDFIVYAPDRNLLVDVKGRKFPSGAETNGHKWENWATKDDLESLLRWQRVFGNDFRAVLVFAYHVIHPRWLCELEDPFEFRGKTYSFYGVWVNEYFLQMRGRSASWETVSLPSRAFRELRLPMADFFQSARDVAEIPKYPVETG